MKNSVKLLPKNDAGRDFVIGDLHGSYSLLIDGLAELSFDPSVDRVISVGDLIDRGPSSVDCLRLLREPWFHSVLANHEQLALMAFERPEIAWLWYENGGDWGMAYNAALQNWKADKHPLSDEHLEIKDLFELVEDLPFLITIEGDVPTHIIHAEFPPGHRDVTTADLRDPQFVRELATVQTRDGDAFCWSRGLFQPFHRAQPALYGVVGVNRMFLPSSDIGRIISGHTIMHHPVTINNHTNIDTGAYNCYREGKHGALTIVDLNAWKFYAVTEAGLTPADTTVLEVK